MIVFPTVLSSSLDLMLSNSKVCNSSTNRRCSVKKTSSFPDIIKTNVAIIYTIALTKRAFLSYMVPNLSSRFTIVKWLWYSIRKGPL